MSARRLPVYVLIDTSGGMRGEPIQAVNVGLRAMVSALRQDPYALESVYLCLVTFDLEAKEVVPLTALEDVALPEISAPQAAAPMLGGALDLLLRCVDRDVIRTTADRKGDWRPLLFILTGGKAADIQAYREAIVEVKRRNFGNIVACAAGHKAKPDQLRELTHTVVSLDTTDSSAFLAFFRWVSASISFGSSSAGATSPTVLPPPPAEVQVVL